MNAGSKAASAPDRRVITAAELRSLLRRLVSENVGVPEAEIDDSRLLVDYGLTSRAAVGLAGRLEQVLGLPLRATLMWEAPTIEQLTQRLCEVQESAAQETDDDVPGERQPVPGEPCPIAVVGLGCRLPGGVTGPESFWKQLLDGRDFVGDVPPGRRHAFAGALRGAARGERGAFLDDVDSFDAGYFGITPREAEVMDPQQRLILEVACEALDHAGRPAPLLAGSDTGVFVGLSALEYGHLTTADPRRLTPWTTTGAAGSITANRLSYLFDLHGPSVMLDTACSSSLVAVHQACRSLSTGECDTALAAGVNVLLLPTVTASFEQAGALAADRRCKPFDAAADGIARGEGCAVVVLRRLADAERDGDRVLAVIRGTAVNSDGRSAGLMAPNPAAQENLLRAALRNAQVEPTTIDYVETHGTGTLLGDPMEAGALGAVIGHGRPDGRPLLIGSVKSNLGHLEGAAGIVGLVKTVLALHHRRIPPTLHFRTPNPHIDFDELRLRVVSSPTAWPERGTRPARAGVSAFGFGGTNAHVVLEQAPAGASRSRDARGHDSEETPRHRHVLVVSARSRQRLGDAATALARLTASDDAPPLRDLAHTLARYRRGEVCAAVVARTHEEAAGLLAGLAREDEGVGIVLPGPDRSAARPAEDRRAVFVFSGHGSQWQHMGRRLLAGDPLFEAEVRALDPVYLEETGRHTLSGLLDSQAGQGVDHTQPALFGLQVALARTLTAYGVLPAAVIGHSVGEVSAAVIAGALTPADGLRVVRNRSALLSAIDTQGSGAMAAIELPAEERAGVLGRFPGVEIAVYSSPYRCTVSGPAEAVRRLVDELSAAGRLTRVLNVGGAGHSPAVEGVLPKLREALTSLCPRPAEVPWYSTVLDEPCAVAADAAYWCANVRRPVRLHQAVEAAVRDGNDVFVEISPHPIALVPVSESARAVEGAPEPLVVPTLDKRGDEPTDLRAALVRLHFAGVRVDGELLWPAGRRVALPSPAWRHERFWFDRAVTGAPAGSAYGNGPLGVRTDDPRGDTVLWQTDLGTAGTDRPERLVHGQPVLTLPQAAALVIAASQDVHGQDGVTGLCLEDVAIHRWLPLARSTPVTIVWEPADDQATVTVNARAADGSWHCHASARVRVRTDAPVGEPDGAADAPAVIGRWVPADPEAGEPASARCEDLLTALLCAPVRTPEPTEHGLLAPDRSPLPTAVRLLHIERFATDEPVTIEGLRTEPPPPARREAGAPAVPGDAGMAWNLVARGARTRVSARGVEFHSADRHEVPRPLEALSYEVQWRKSPVPLPGRLDRVLLLSDEPTPHGEGGVTAALEAALRRKDVRTTTCASSSHDVERVLADWLGGIGQDERTAVVLLLPGPSTGPGDTGALHTAFTIARRLCADAAGGTRPRLWFVTQGARSVTPGEPGEPGLACLRGLVRALALEQPALRASLVDAAPASADELLQELLGDSHEDEVAWRTGTRLVARLSPADLTAQQYEKPFVRRDGAYIVTGGLTGLGLATAGRLAGQGAGHLVLNGRRAPEPEAQRVIGELRGRGTAVTVVQGDIAEPGVAARLVRAATERGHELRGVAHCAGVLHDRLITDVDADDVDTVLRPKVIGAMRLEEALRTHDIDWWVFYSSAAALLGSPGQSAYAAANAWLDALAQRRRSEGRPATSIAWGPWSGTGGVPEDRATVLRPLGTEEGLDALQALVVHDRTHTGVAHFDSDMVLAAYPGVSSLPFFADAVRDGGAAEEDGWAGPEGIEALGDGAAEKVHGRLVTRVAAIMGFGVTDLDETAPLPRLGLDSLMAVRIRHAVQQDFGVDLPPDLMLRGATLQEVGGFVRESLGLAGERAGTGTAAGAPREATAADCAPPSAPALPTSIQPRDAAERLVAGAWGEVLEERPEDVYSDFAAAGGNERTAQRLVETVRGRLGGVPLDLTAESVLAERTVAAIAELIRPAVNSRGTHAVSVLRPPVAGTAKRPLFTFHPAGGPTSVYQPLTQLLPSDQPVYGMERLDDRDTLEEKAAAYVSLIRDLQPEGPYHLIGWSFGGCLAYETALQLRDSGARVGFLGLIDTILPAALPDLGADELLERFRRFTEYVRTTYGRDLDLSYDELARTPERQHIDVVMRKVAEAGLDMSPGIMEHQRTSYIDARVGERYTPRPTDLPVVLYRAQQPQPLTTALDPRYLRTEADLGWAPLCPRLDVVPVPGDHLSLIDPPHVTVIARHLTEALDAAHGRP
ncbi:SDR family NAD(P)-dependent oxidoreductase [Streptomyces sp. bgisy032]|uniref:SDR family NAD(P)-dependent oxidoreductase n=1 Tax=Streptomyces sp. bgisy032 TaxID=3413773 RepID=UPI003D73153B